MEGRGIDVGEGMTRKGVLFISVVDAPERLGGAPSAGMRVADGNERYDLPSITVVCPYVPAELTGIVAVPCNCTTGVPEMKVVFAPGMLRPSTIGTLVGPGMRRKGTPLIFVVWPLCGPGGTSTV